MKHFVQASGTVLLVILILALSAVPAYALGRAARISKQQTSLDATIYLPTAELQSLFQGRVDQRVPGTVSTAISNIISTLPQADRGWATQMATTLIQPSAAVTQMTPQQNGIATTLRLSLYPGDPKPVDATIMVAFSALNSNTIQVSAQPVNGSPTLVNGPLTTFQVPVGQLNKVSTTASCGNSALALDLQVPISLGQGTAPAAQVQNTALLADSTSLQHHAFDGTMNAYAEISASSLASLGSSIGTLPVNNTLSAQNIQIATQNGQLTLTANIMWGALQIATATSYVQPMAQGGNLAVHVAKTTLTVLKIFTFPYDHYNQQIEQTLNSKLSGAFAGKFNVTDVSIGSNANVPCADSGSMILTGTVAQV